MRSPFVAVAAALVFALTGMALADPSPKADVLRVRGELLASQGRCEDALPVFDAATEANPADGRAATLAGRCLIRLRRYKEAAERLSAAVAAQESPERAQLDLVTARYHAGDAAGAAEALEAARPVHGSDPEFALYEGMMLLEAGRARESAEALARAQQGGDDSITTVASFYEGVAWSRARDAERAERAFARVRARDVDGPWSRLLSSALRRPTGDERWLYVSVGGEWDTNVPLRGDDVILPGELANGSATTSDLSEEEGFRFVWALNGGLELFRNRDWSGGVALRYTGSAHTDQDHDQDLFDTHFPVVSFWVDRALSESLVAQVQYDTGYAWVDSEPFLFPHTFTTALHQSWDNGQKTRVFARGYDRDYKFEGPVDVAPTVGLDENGNDLNEARDRERDSVGINLGLAHDVPLDALASSLTLGYVFHANEAKGEEYDYRAHELRAATRTELPAGFAIELAGGYTYKPHENRSTFPNLPVVASPYRLSGEKRRDRIWRGQIVVEKDLSDTLTAGARYRYTRHGSNVDAFDYSRAIAGAYVTLKLQ